MKRNIERFPEDFMFQLTKEEYNSLKCQNGTSNKRGGDRRALPYVFTQQGVGMLSGLLMRIANLMGASLKDMGAGLCAITEMQASPETIVGMLK